MKLKFSLYLLSVVLLLFAFSVQETAFAQSNCLPVNNGGTTARQVCTNATSSQENTTPTQATAPQQTKGGLPIYPASNTKSTPSTGPEDWALPSLLFLGATGLLLRNKTKSYFQKS
jgi:hypothetical protein